ncbi:AraC family transcriptional regulator [Paenibacillus sp. LHD-117]|uniref:AraC family transcriptional regulator n=1 Tax=Paenibacillus sp. LHD-117 TaxID=3071412 RepID=UPI0027E15A5F|nr:AraC family transcriptional regulator [Paenibacillus sp. LHD-117]MDQ6419322.1 AraC family transcriptional regulator [Paenibacillus sp. LHD-117]
MSAKEQSYVIPKEKVIFAHNYPLIVVETIGVTSLYQRMHWHDVLEINLIKSGSGYYIINGQTYEFEQGDVFLINSNDLHCAYETEDLVMLVVTFDPSWLAHGLRMDPELLSPFREMGKHYTNRLQRDHSSIGHLRSLLMELQEEHEGQRRSYSTMVHSLLLRFLATVNREFRSANPRKNGGNISARQLERMRQVIMVMEERYAHPWTQEELAALVFLSPSRFSDIFKRAVGMPPMLYLIHIRLERALAMLEKGGMKITDIALECGFQTLTNFNRLFKKHIGITPGATRKGNVKNQ